MFESCQQPDLSNLKYNWEWKPEFQTWEIKIPVKVAHIAGEWHIYFQQRPYYCDRGRFHCNVDGIGTGDPDDQEGFPRYYFSLQRGMEEMEEWIDIRKEVLRKELETKNKVQAL